MEHTSGATTAALYASLSSTARSALSELSRLPLDAEVDDRVLTDFIETLEQLGRIAQAEKLRLIGELRSRQAAPSLGGRSAEDLLAERLRQSKGSARRDGELADGLTDLPEVRDAFAAGDLGAEQAAAAAKAAKELRDTDLDDQQRERARRDLDRACAKAGATGSPRDVRDAAEEVLNDAAEDRLAERDRRARRRRGGRTWDNRDGTHTWQFRVTAPDSEKVKAALHHLAARDGERDPRSYDQRVADAFVAACTRTARGGDDGAAAGTGGAPAQVILLITPEALHDHPDAEPAWLDGVGPVASATARQLCCDAQITPVTVRNGEVLDVGRTQRTATPKQRLAVIARDRTCVGCGAAAARCEVHHIHWYRHGGRTDLDNLVLVCGSCHHAIHHNRWVVHRQDGTFALERPKALQPRRAGPPPCTSSRPPDRRPPRDPHPADRQPDGQREPQPR